MKPKPPEVKPPKINSRPPKGGWANGNYMCLCLTCREEFWGDKRAYECADCAYKLSTLDGGGK